MSSSIPFGLSIDMDSVSRHLQGYGIAAPDRCNRHLEIASQRILELLSDCNARATFFIVADEAYAARSVLREIAASGHEIASHSWSHLVPFKPRSEREWTRELADSRACLEDVTGNAVRGFRAPGWHYSMDLVTRLAQYGYRYDSSMFPSWMLLLLRASVKQRSSTSKEWISFNDLRQVIAKRTPGIPQSSTDMTTEAIYELPLCCSPIVRLPYYHTMSHLLPKSIFQLLSADLSRRPYVHYVFHAIDFLGLDEDRLPVDIKRHPGMATPLAEKVCTIRNRLLRIGQHRQLTALSYLLQHFACSEQISTEKKEPLGCRS